MSHINRKTNINTHFSGLKLQHVFGNHRHQGKIEVLNNYCNTFMLNSPKSGYIRLKADLLYLAFATVLLNSYKQV